MDEPSRSLLDASAGRIERLFLTVPTFAVRDFGEAIHNTLTALPPLAAIDVLAAPDVRSEVAAWLSDHAGPVAIHPAPKALNFSQWAQDALIAAVGADGAPVLLTPDGFERYDDLAAARRLAAAAAIPLVEKGPPIDGGNLLAAGDLLLVGADNVRPEPDVIDPTRRLVEIGCAAPVNGPEEVPAEHLPEGWTEVRRVASPEGSRQPLFHIDLFVAPAGPSRFLVGCPRLGARLLRLPLLPHADADRFDEAAAALTAAGAEVVRNPLPMIWMDELERRRRTWLHLPTNNVLVEDCGPGDRRVWLPTFAQAHWAELEAIDRENAHIWESLGFEVRPIPNLMALAENRGALRCMVKVVARAPA